MRLAHFLALPASILSLLSPALASGASYNEHLDLKPLPNGALYAGFSFTSTTPLSSYTTNHFRYFPRSLAQILQYTHAAELHLRFALGRWDDEAWGRRPRGGGREGGNGVELWAWLEDGEGKEDAAERWSDLVNSLSGLFCASLNFVDSGKTSRPVLTFSPEGTLDELQRVQTNVTGQRQGELQLLHGMLPHEVVCTENLTPFLKLLPCKGKAGISTLLDGHKLFDANWQTMAVDVRPVCPPAGQEGECNIEIEQTVDMVLDIQRSMRPRESPIPRPPPIEEVVCDESKGFNPHDTCYPKQLEGEMEWSLSRIFGRPIRGSCPLAEPGSNTFDVSLEVPSSRTVEVVANARVHQMKMAEQNSIGYKLNQGQDFDLFLPQQNITEGQVSDVHGLHEPPLYASRQMTGYGAERGGMHILLRNPHNYPQRIVYLESLPWFLRPYMHTLKLAASTTSAGDDKKLLEKMYYTPALDRLRGTTLELSLLVPAESTLSVTYDFEKAILRYTEYPPDANRGFDIPAAVIRVMPHAEGQQHDYFMRTTSLLLPLPTPDFSMPYNVIILTSTVIALGFGSFFNLLVRRFVLVEEVPVSPLAMLIARVKDRLAVLVAEVRMRLKKGSDGPQVASEGSEVNGKLKDASVKATALNGGKKDR